MVNKWEIYFCNLDPTKGSEQRGTRPVMVISTDAVNHNIPVSTVLPLSSVKAGDKIYPTEILLKPVESGLPKLSVAMVQQIRTVAHDRLSNKVSVLADVAKQEEITEALRNYFDMQ